MLPSNSIALAAIEEAWGWRELDPPRARAAALSQPEGVARDVLLAYLDWRAGRHELALRQITRSLEALADPSVWRARAFGVRAGLAMVGLDVNLAHDLYHEQIRAAQGSGDAYEIATATHNLALAYLVLDPPRALPLLEEAVMLFGELKHPEAVGVAHLNLGEFHENRGELALAAQHYGQAAAQGQAGYLVLHVLALSRLVMLHSQHDALAEARRALDELEALPTTTDLEAEVTRARAGVLWTQEASRARWVETHGSLSRPAGASGNDSLSLADPTALTLALLGQTAARQAERLAELEASLAQAEAQRAEAQRLSETDALTGLHNRQYLFSVGPSLVAGASETTPAQAVLIDVDRFKDVNDQHGHASGDAVLREMAALLVGHAQQGDLTARYGGEEFVLLRGAGEPSLLTLLERFRQAVASHPWASQPVTVSIGLTLMTDGNLQAALDRADSWMYAAKHAGGNQVQHDLPMDWDGGWMPTGQRREPVC